MKPLTIIYSCRIVLGIIAGLACTLLGRESFLSGLSFGILFYILTYYILKTRFVTKVEKTSKLFMMGIGAYFMSLVVSWALFFTIIYH